MLRSVVVENDDIVEEDEEEEEEEEAEEWIGKAWRLQAGDVSWNSMLIKKSVS